MNLYDLDRRCIDIIVSNVDENGEISEEGLELLAKEPEDAAVWYKNQKAEADALTAEIKSLTERKRKCVSNCEKVIEWFEKYPYITVKTARAVVSRRKASRVEIRDETVLADEFFRIKREPSKTKIKDAIKAGRLVAGAELIDTISVSIK